MKFLVLLAVATFLWGCGPDRNLVMDTKFDVSLRQKIMSLSSDARSEDLTILGKCSGPIGGTLREQLTSAGAEVLTMNGDLFTARISSDDLFSLAALEQIVQLQLAQTLNPLPQ